MSYFIKICGITNQTDLDLVISLPIDGVGFNLYEKSKRFVDYKKLKSLINFNKKDVSFVSVLVKPNDEILEKIKDLGKTLNVVVNMSGRGDKDLYSVMNNDS